MLKKLRLIKQEFFAFSKNERLFVLFSMACVFFIAGEYSVTRPASNSIFISVFSTKAFPIVWLCTVPINFFVVSCYNRYLSQIGYKKVFLIAGLCVIAANAFTAYFQEKFPMLIFIQFIWKDIYILLMFKQLWSMIHSTIEREKASYLYGVIFGMGGIGSILGSALPSFFAIKMGSINLFYFTLPFYLIIILFYFAAFKKSKLSAHHKTSKPSLQSNGFSTVRKSKYLKGILLLVILMQLSVALTDFQFNTYLEWNIPNQDLRTQFCGRIVGLINIFTTCLQFLGGFMLTKYLGLKNSHTLVPSLIVANICLFLVFPGFLMITYSLVAIKTVDYSLFGLIREMLYLPLDKEGRFKAKAVIDVFAYRTSRAFASFIILVLQAFAISYVMHFVSIMLVFLCVFWLFIVRNLFKFDYEPSLN